MADCISIRTTGLTRRLESMLQKLVAGSDDFLSEKLHDQLASILGEWSAAWRASPRNLRPIAGALAEDFEGHSFDEENGKVLRQDAALQLRRISYSPRPLQRASFWSTFEKWLSGFLAADHRRFSLSRVLINCIRACATGD